MTVKQADAVRFLSELPRGEIDLIVTDPAYESLEKHRARGTTTRLKLSKSSSNQWFDIFPNTRFEDFFAEAYRTLKRNAHLYVMTDQETMHLIKPIGERIGFKFWKFIIWDKQRLGMGYHYRSQHELICFFEKGKRKLNHLGISDVLRVPSVRGGYPTEKPVELSRVLIRQSSDRGELVCDPFCGSGSTGEAAVIEERAFIGCDIFSTAVLQASARIEAAKGKKAC